MNTLNNRKTNKALGLITLLLWLTTLSEGWAAGGTMTIWWGSFPDFPASATNVVAISSGFGFQTALASDGTVLCWGDNSIGQLNLPSGLTNVVAISAVSTH